MTEPFQTPGHYIDPGRGSRRRRGRCWTQARWRGPRRAPVQPKDGEAALTVQQAAHRDADADWTKKHGRSYFGYKNHVNADVAHGSFCAYADASVARPAAHQRVAGRFSRQKGRPL